MLGRRGQEVSLWGGRFFVRGPVSAPGELSSIRIDPPGLHVSGPHSAKIFWGFVAQGRLHGREYLIVVPLYAPLAALLLPTAFLWYCDRRSPPGHCQRCGYDLTGNTSSVCPECGAEAARKRCEAPEV
ncbi:MAG: hypothetical protein JXQ73_15410 [Phycisphaerae bacterium]|nr:hypothetical protein [Phycisphaerae bacterium]